jgi:hypothetical protein
MTLDAAEDLQCCLRAALAAVCLQPHAHHAIHQQCEEADQRVRTDAIGQSMEDRRDVQVVLEHAEAALDVGQTLVAFDDLRSDEVVDIGQQHELAVEHFGALNGRFIHAITEAVGEIVGLDEAVQFGIRDGLLEAAVSAAIAGATAACGLALILRIELGDGVERLAIDGDRRHLSIRVINPQSKGWFGNWGGASSGDTRLEITVPTHSSVVVEGVSAAIDIKGVGGRRLSVNSVSGNAQVEASPGEAKIASVSGDLHLHLDTNRIHAETVNGDLDLQGRINGEVSVETVSGHIVLRADNPNDIDVSAVSGDAELRTGLAPGGQLKAESTSGDLTLTLPSTSSAQLKLSSFSGSIHSDSGNVEVPEHGPGASLKTRLGRGDASITLESFSGDLRVRLASEKLE